VSLRGANLLVTVSKALWNFLIDTGHPLMPADSSVVNWAALDEVTHGKLLEALRPIVVCEEQINGESRSLSAWIAIAESRPEGEEAPVEDAEEDERFVQMPSPEPAAEIFSPTSKLPKAVETIEELPKMAAETVAPSATLGVVQPPKKVEKSKTFNIKQTISS